MQFDPPLQSGVLIQRYKRFLADVRLDSGASRRYVAVDGGMTMC